MPPSYNQAVDTLADNLKFMLSRKGIDILDARAAYLAEYKLTRTDADEVRSIIVDILGAAEPVFWPTRFCDILEQSFGTLPTSWRLTDPMLFTPQGFIHFERPIKLQASHPPGDMCMGAADTVAGIGWRKDRGTVFINMTAWVNPSDPSLMSVFPPKWMISRVSSKTYTVLDRLVRKAHERNNVGNAHHSPGADGIARHIEDGLTSIDLGRADALLEVVSEALDAEQERYRLLMRDALSECGVIRIGGIPWSITPWRSGQTVEQTLAVHMTAIQSPDEACAFCSGSYLRLFATALNFLSTKVFVSVPSHIDRTVMRRLVRNKTHKPQWDAVNVVTLRRAENVKHESDEEHRTVEWSGHWGVGFASGGFWRHQPMKNEQGEWIKQWRWIMPYIKGDLNKPFIPPKKRIYNVTR